MLTKVRGVVDFYLFSGDSRLARRLKTCHVPSRLTKTVASASNPDPASGRAEHSSRGLGITKAPSRSCNALNFSALSFWFVIKKVLDSIKWNYPSC